MDESTRLDYEAALAACAGGDRAALRTLYDAEVRQMLGVALRIVRQRQVAEDVVQDAFVSIWQKASSFDPRRGSARGWLYSIVRYRALNHVRDRASEVVLDEAALEAIDLRTVLDTHAATPPGVDTESLRRCLAQLDEGKRSSIVLAYVDGCTHAEIAARLTAPLGTVKAWIRRGLQSLRECMT